MRVLGIFAVLVAFAMAPASHASEGPPPKLNPKTYTSPSGLYALYINPSEQHGVGKGTYTMSRQGQALWSKALPYTFWEAAVTDEGKTAGYAYSHGYQGWGAKGDTFGDLVVALLGPDGSELSREATARTALGWSCPPDREPSPRGLVLQPDLGRFAIRLDKQQAAFMHNGECWWTYSLADGKRGGELTLAAPARTEQLWYFAVDADAVPGTELTLITWSRTDWRPNSASDEGCRLSLVDKAAREVWSLQWATEFKGVQYFSPWDLKEYDVTPAGRFAPRQFVYLSYSRQAALTFTVVPTGEGAWTPRGRPGWPLPTPPTSPTPPARRRAAAGRAPRARAAGHRHARPGPRARGAGDHGVCL